MPKKNVDLRKKLAELAHQRWAHWMKYILMISKENVDRSVTIPAWAVERWKRQIETPFDRLSDKEQGSDYGEADLVLELLPTNEMSWGDTEPNQTSAK